MKPLGAAGASAATEAAGARLATSPDPRYERRWMALGVLVIALIMILLDATVVNVAPALGAGRPRLLRRQPPVDDHRLRAGLRQFASAWGSAGRRFRPQGHVHRG